MKKITKSAYEIKDASNEGDSSSLHSSSLDDLILYVKGYNKSIGWGDFGVRRNMGFDLVLLDPKTGNYKTLAEEDSRISVVSPVGDKIFYIADFDWSNKESYNRLVLLDPKTQSSEILVKEKRGEFSSTKEERNIVSAAVPFGDKILYARGDLIEEIRQIYSVGSYRRSTRKNGELALLDPKTKSSEILMKDDCWIPAVVPFGDQIIYIRNTKGSQWNVVEMVIDENCYLVLFDPKTKKDKILVTEEYDVMRYAIPFGDKIIYTTGYSVRLLDPETRKTEILAEKDYWILNVAPFGDKILYTGKSTKGNIDTHVLVLLDPKTKSSKTLIESDHTAVPTVVTLDDKILYAENFIDDDAGKRSRLTLLDPVTEISEILAIENSQISTAVPVKRSIFGSLLE